MAELVDALDLGPVSKDVGVRVPPRAPSAAADRSRRSQINQDLRNVTIKTVETENEGLKRAFMLTIPAKDIEARVDQEVKRHRAAGAHARLPPRQGAAEPDPEDARRQRCSAMR